MSFVQRSPYEMSDVLAEKLAEEFGDVLDDICCTLECDCDDESHGMIIVTWEKFISDLRAFDGDMNNADPVFLRIFMEMLLPVMEYAQHMDQDPLDVVREHTFRLE